MKHYVNVTASVSLNNKQLRWYANKQIGNSPLSFTGENESTCLKSFWLSDYFVIIIHLYLCLKTPWVM